MEVAAGIHSYLPLWTWTVIWAMPTTLKHPLSSCRPPQPLSELFALQRSTISTTPSTTLQFYVFLTRKPPRYTSSSSILVRLLFHGCLYTPTFLPSVLLSTHSHLFSPPCVCSRIGMLIFTFLYSSPSHQTAVFEALARLNRKAELDTHSKTKHAELVSNRKKELLELQVQPCSLLCDPPVLFARCEGVVPM